ncbi:hypothetical protein Pcinc_021960 [Petrolisthes cinctipes]|uniref:Uncharacterized protein n=1 Tax=Petrolisthes cinctipes TaxID=88211 RepID=A0AAE1FEK7_PETCI|nr:hypothetical protein Pcinc_021960 [Petrolisthes cinctipes]
MAPTPTMEPMTVDEEWRRMAREHPVMRMTRNDKARTSWCDQFSLAHMGLGRTTNTVGPAQFHVWGYIFDTSKMMGVHCLHRREEISPCSMQLP